MGTNYDAISLDFYQQEYKKYMEQYSLQSGQLEYTSHPIDAIRKCSPDVERYPIVILFHRIPVGFFVLHGWGGVKSYSNNRNAILLRAYSVDSQYQGKGIAKQSLKLLSPFVKKHFLEREEIILAVNYKNTHAQMLYKKSGFIDKGTRVMGRKGKQFVFGKTI